MNSICFRFFTGLALLIVLGCYLDVASLYRLLSSCQLETLIIAWLALSGTILTGTLSWKIILKSLGFHLNFWSSLKLTLAAYGLNNLLIGGIWGELYRLKAAQKYSIPPVAAAYAIIFEMWASACALLIAAFISLSFSGFRLDKRYFEFVHINSLIPFATYINANTFIILCLITLVIALICIYCLFSDFIVYSQITKDQHKLSQDSNKSHYTFYKNIENKIVNFSVKLGISKDYFYQNIDYIINNKKSIKRSLIIAICINIFTSASEALSYVFLAESINIAAKFYQFLSTVPIFSVLSWLPISINGLGVQEAAALITWQPFGFNREAIVTISALNHICKLAWAILGVAIYMLSNPKQNSVKNN